MKTTTINLNKKNIKKILVTRMQGMGDVICFIPTLKALRKGFPDAEITILTGRPEGREVIYGCSYADKIIFYDVEKRRNYFEKFKFIMSLRKEKFDAVIVSSEDIGFGLKAFLSGAKYRIGFREYIVNGARGKDLFGFLYTTSLEHVNGEHEIDANLRLIKVMGEQADDRSLELCIRNKDVLFIDNMLQDLKLQNEILVVVNPSARKKTRNWPLENYAKLLKYLLNKYSLHVLLISGKEDAKLCDNLCRLTGLPTINLAGQITIGQSKALLKKCYLFIGNDTGTAHIAAALNIPSVILFGPGDENQYRPYSKNSIIINKHVDCAPCNKKECESMQCMTAISVDETLEAVESFFKEN